MNYKLFNNNTKIPTKSYTYDGGFDLYLPTEVIIHPFETICVGLGIGFEVPKGYAGMLVPRSSTAKKGLISQTQLIDCGYTGEIHLVLTNCSLETYSFEKDTRLVSFVVYNILNEQLTEVKEFQETDRGSKGLGSSGK